MKAEKNPDPEKNQREQSMFSNKETAGKDQQQLKKDEVGAPVDTPREKKSFMDVLKKVGFSVWLGIMIVGGILAFITSLFLV